MEQTVVEKMKRFVELSAKFSKTESDVFPKKPTNEGNYLTFSTGGGNNWSASPVGLGSNTLHVSGTFVLNGKEIFVDGSGNVRAKDNKELTRGERIEAEARALAMLSDEFDEYNSLRYLLTDYFRVVNKLEA